MSLSQSMSFGSGKVMEKENTTVFTVKLEEWITLEEKETKVDGARGSIREFDLYDDNHDHWDMQYIILTVLGASKDGLMEATVDQLDGYFKRSEYAITRFCALPSQMGKGYAAVASSDIMVNIHTIRIVDHNDKLLFVVYLKKLAWFKAGDTIRDDEGNSYVFVEDLISGGASIEDSDLFLLGSKKVIEVLCEQQYLIPLTGKSYTAPKGNFVVIE